MKVNFYVTNNDPVHDRTIKALYEGCPIDKELRSVKDYEPSDIAVVFGVRKKAVPFSRFRGDILDNQNYNKLRTIVLETGYIKRGDGENNYYAVGLGGLNGRADFKNYLMPGDRWEALGANLKDWRDTGHHILVCGQVPWDASVDFTNHLDWIDDVIDRIRSFTDRKIIFRAHPKAPNYFPIGVESSRRPITEDLKNAWAVVNFNSNSGVEAVIEGIPTFVGDVGSMVYSVANTDLSLIENPKMVDRTQWAYDIAYCQWKLDEMRSGETWNHLFRS